MLEFFDSLVSDNILIWGVYFGALAGAIRLIAKGVRDGKEP